MATPKSRDREQLPQQPSLTTDAKITEIERHLEQRARSRAPEVGAETQARDASEAAIHEAEVKELAEFRTRAESEALEKKSDASGSAKENPQQVREQKVTVQWLREHEQEPDLALEALTQLATSEPGGLEKAKVLLEQIAADPGGASIVDSFHGQMQKLVSGETGVQPKGEKGD